MGRPGPVVLLCGHGGSDPGAVDNGVVEAEYVRDVAYDVILDNDVVVLDRAGPVTVRGDWTRQVAKESGGRPLVVSLHVNHYPDPRWRGALAFFPGELAHLRLPCQRFLNSLPAPLRVPGRQAMPITDKTIKHWPRVAHVLRPHTPHADVVCLETFYCSQPGEARFALSESGRQAIKRAVSTLIETWKGDNG